MADTPRNEFRNLMRAYAGFQMATALVVASKFGDVYWAGTIVSLFAISIPSTLAYPSFVRLTQEDEKQNPASLMAICFILAFFPSVAAISLMLAPVSIFAAVAFPVTSLAWGIVVFRLQNITMSMCLTSHPNKMLNSFPISTPNPAFERDAAKARRPSTLR